MYKQILFFIINYFYTNILEYYIFMVLDIYTNVNNNNNNNNKTNVVDVLSNIRETEKNYIMRVRAK